MSTQKDYLHASNAENRRSTGEAMKEALLSLMERQSFETISVTALCRRAGVSRNAFYRNYASMGRIIDEIMLDFNRELSERIGSPFRAKDPRTWYRTFLEQVKGRETLFRLLAENGMQGRYIHLVNRYLLRELEPGNRRQRFIVYEWNGAVQNAIWEVIREGGDVLALEDTFMELFGEYDSNGEKNRGR